MSNRGWAAAVAIFVMSVGALAPAGAQGALRTLLDLQLAPPSRS